MPRIDPLQLLECLHVLLTSDGGILSKNEVHRLAGLMTKFSKKLVSKCIYVLILKKTEKTLLDAFMNAGGWTLVQMWLHDANNNRNWPLVVELLELLLVTPVDVARLKSYNIPRMVKGLSKREDLETICKLSNQLVQQWLKIVKDETQYDTNQQAIKLGIVAQPAVVVVKPEEEMETDSKDLTISTKTFYEVGTKNSPVEATDVKIKEETKQENKEKIRDEVKDEDKKKSLDKSKHKSSSKSSSRDKERSSLHRSKDRHSSSSSTSREKSHKDKRDRDRHRSNGSVKSSSSSSKSSRSSKHKEKDKKENKQNQAEKDKDTLAKIQPQSLQKLPKIPKKSGDEKEKSKDGKDQKSEEARKGSISIEVRKTNEERPKTVKVYKSKMRLTGLEEEAKPAPPRPVKKPSTVPIIPPPASLKRPSPPRDTAITPPEKKSKIEVPLEKPGSIKLIPPKPKPPVLQESDMFMDALTASATAKKEPKKRKRRTSVSKDSTTSSPPESPTINAGIKNMTPPKFYQDTLETEEAKSDEKGEDKESLDTTIDEEESSPAEASPVVKQMEEVESEAVVKNVNGLRGVLVYVRRKGPKKSIKWKSDDELVDIQYFELDETERVNVTKTFGDMAKMDLRSERELIEMSRKLPNEDVMDVHTPWKVPMEIDLPELLAIPGSKSLEKDIQFAREKSVLQALYFTKRMLPDSPGEPDFENYQVKDPITIPIEDAENPDHDFRNTPWPEPKGSPPQISNVPNAPNPVFPNVPQVPFQNFGVGQPPAAFPNLNMQNNMQAFPSGPQFMQPNVMGGQDWNNGNVGPMPNVPMMHPNMGPPDMMNQQGPMNPNLFMQSQENFNPMMNDNNHRFPPPFNPQGPQMFPPNNFNMNRGGHGGGGGGGGFRRGSGSGPWLRMNGPPPGSWNNMRGGGGPHRGGVRLCNNVRNKGFCRNRETCQFFHPNS